MVLSTAGGEAASVAVGGTIGQDFLQWIVLVGKTMWLVVELIECEFKWKVIDLKFIGDTMPSPSSMWSSRSFSWPCTPSTSGRTCTMGSA